MSTTAAPEAKSSASIFSDSFESDPALIPATPPSFAVRLFNKCAYGPRPTDVAAFNALGSNDDARLNAWLNRQLDPDSINDTACQNRINSGQYSTINMSLEQLWTTHHVPQTGSGAWPRRYYPVDEATCIKLIRAVYSERQLYEVMVDFWHNHFNVYGWDYSIAPTFMYYDRDVMRGRASANSKPYALGNFRQMLEQMAKSTAMMFYLNNRTSRGSSYNENFARELCELHTLGAENYYPTTDPNAVPRYPDGTPRGYCDNDVYEAARALTGWTIEDGRYLSGSSPNIIYLPNTGKFTYIAPWHDKAGKLFIGQYLLPNAPDMKDGRDVMDILCKHEGTARHICRKLCRRFISDNPPQSLINSAAAIWKDNWQAPDQIAKVLRHILTSAAFKNTWAEKTKRPWEAFMHALRATSAEITPRPRPADGWTSYTELFDRITASGNSPFRWPAPDGHPDAGEKWQAVSPLAQTWRTLSRLTELRIPDGSETNPDDYFMRIQKITATQFPSEAAGTTVNAVIDFWIQRIYGYRIAPERRARLVRFLGQNANIAAAGAVQLRWDNEWSSDLSRYYTLSRLRATVALMMMMPEFYHR